MPMADNEVQIGLQYTYKDGRYVVTKCDNIEMKSPQDGNWYPAVAYRPINGENVYVRELEDFKEKFKPC